MKSNALPAKDQSFEQRNYEFDSILLSSILKISLDVFGKNTAEIVLSYMVYLSGLKREDFPARIELFKELLVEVLGCGSRVVEKLIVRDIYSRLSIRMVDIDDFVSAINNARNAYVRLKDRLVVLEDQRVRG
ncbi:MAG: hypothetical protein ACUVTL_11315 [Thermoproteota archaeon]